MQAITKKADTSNTQLESVSVRLSWHGRKYRVGDTEPNLSATFDLIRNMQRELLDLSSKVGFGTVDEI